MATIKYWLSSHRNARPPTWTHQLRSAAYTLSILSHPMRLSIMLRLAEGQRHIGQLSKEMSANVNTLSGYLGQLRQGGLVMTEHKGTRSYHSLTDKGRQMVRFIRDTFTATDLQQPV
jgi:DNA-binding HxlR family transcriptional regulator